MRSGEGYSGVNCPSPHRIVGRLLARLRWSNRRREKGIERRNDGVAQVDGFDSRDSSSLGPAIDPSSDAERCRGESSLNLGIGGSLLCLMAASKIELNKMMELRIQMETILQNAKEELQRKDAFFNTPPPPPPPLETNEIFTFSAAPEGAESNSQLSPSTTVVSDQCLESDMAKSEGCFEGMNQLEAELEMELERLQLCLDAEKVLGNTPQGSMMVNEENTSVRTNSFSSSEVIDPGNDIPADCSEEQHGIPPFELERKLHELLEARQQERIRELEAALECAELKLREKETEISWWKDTAHLLSQHVSESSCRPFPPLH